MNQATATASAVEASSTTSSPSNRRAVVFIFITLLIDSIGFGIILPVVPALIMQLTGEGLGAAAKYGGWLAVYYASMQFIFSPILGGLSDRFGRRPILLFCLLALGLDYVVMGVAPSYGWLVVGRLIAGIAGATYGPAYAYLADVSSPEKRAANFGIAGIAFGIGFIVGPAIGGLLGSLGPRIPFFAAASLALANATLGFFALPESLKPESRRKFEWSRANPLGTLVQMSNYPAVLGIAAAAFFWQLGHQVLPSMWAYYTMYKFSWTSAEVGWSLAATGVVMAIGQGFLTRWLIPRVGGERHAALLATTLGTAIFCLYAFATASWMMYAGTTCWLIVSLAWPSINALMSQQIPANAQGELQGGMASLSSINSILGPFCATQLFSYFTSDGAPHFPGAPFLAAAALGAMSTLILFLATATKTRPASDTIRS